MWAIVTVLGVTAASSAHAEHWRCVIPGGDYIVIVNDNLVAAVRQARAHFNQNAQCWPGFSQLPDGATGNAQQEQAAKADAAPPQNVKAQLTGARFATPGFKAEALNTESQLTAIYLGDFEHARLDRNGGELGVIVGTYITAFDNRCRAYLPADKIELTRSECAREQHTVNGYGVQVGPSVCTEYRDVPTGVHADPRLAEAQGRVARALGVDLMAKTFANPGAGISGVLEARNAIGNDMDKLLQMNGCNSLGIQRFQANLVRFAQREPALRLPKGDSLESTRIAVTPSTANGTAFKDSNYVRLMDDLIAESSQSWLMNRYTRNSVGQLQVLGRDPTGRPEAIYAYYSFSNGSGRSARSARSAVKLVFEDGLPSCLYFNDQPQNCRSASRRIVNQYEGGQYLN